MWEQLAFAAFLQRHWADNQVSCTVTFDPETEGPQLKHALDLVRKEGRKEGRKRGRKEGRGEEEGQRASIARKSPLSV
jgi:hypothetical protein